MLNPAVAVYAPWRDPAFLQRFGGRIEMIDFCRERGLPITATHDAPYSTDANLLGLTHEAGQLESLKTPAGFIEPGMGLHPKDARDEIEHFTVAFAGGMPVEINGSPVTPLQALLEATNRWVDGMLSVSASTPSKIGLWVSRAVVSMNHPGWNCLADVTTICFNSF